MRRVKRKIRNKRKISTGKKIALGISIFFLAIFLTAGGYYLHIYKSIYVSDHKNPYGKDMDFSDLDIAEPLYEEQEGITNILLIGIDAREAEEASRSDSMIILTIDSNNEKVKLTSIMRDSYVDIPKYRRRKINAAFSLGGPQLLMKTIEANFRIRLDKYIVVDFHGFENIIDAVGGIEVDVEEHERRELNKFIGETREVKSPPLTRTGYQKLDGQQALAYSRIRKSDSDYRRTERQREVLGILANKLLKTSVVNYPKVMNSILDCVTTNIKPSMLLNYAYTVSKFKNMKIEQLQMPMTELSWGGMYKGEWVLLLDTEQNAAVMNDFIFIDKEPNVDELDLEACNAVIEKLLGRSLASENKTKKPINNEVITSTVDKEKETSNQGQDNPNLPSDSKKTEEEKLDKEDPVTEGDSTGPDEKEEEENTEGKEGEGDKTNPAGDKADEANDGKEELDDKIVDKHPKGK